MANFIYNSARKLFSEGKINWTGVSTATFASYSIKAALVNKTGGTSVGNYTPPADTTNDSIIYVAGDGAPTGSRNMYTDFGLGAVETSSSLIRDSSGNPITATLSNRSLVALTGACDSDDFTFSNVPTSHTHVGNTGTFGAIEGIIIYLEQTPGQGTDAPVLLFIDTLSGPVSMAVVPNSGDVVVNLSSSGIFRL